MTQLQYKQDRIDSLEAELADKRSPAHRSLDHMADEIEEDVRLLLPSRSRPTTSGPFFVSLSVLLHAIA
jgi:hypothetical protein